MKLNRLIRRAVRGFTLIELLVVISIISLLSAVVLNTVNGARIKARDAERVRELGQMQRALELYYHDNGTYPSSLGVVEISSTYSGWYGSSAAAWQNNTNALAQALSRYLSSLPEDPLNNCFPLVNISCYSYGYFSANYPSGIGSGRWYMLIARLNNTSHAIFNTDGVQTCRSTDSDIATYNGGKWSYRNNPTPGWAVQTSIVTLGGDCAVRLTPGP